jgi:hypothetical protein
MIRSSQVKHEAVQRSQPIETCSKWYLKPKSGQLPDENLLISAHCMPETGMRMHSFSLSSLVLIKVLAVATLRGE